MTSHQTLLDAGFSLDPDSHVFVSPRAAAPVPYSDGDDVECRLLRILDQAADVGLGSSDLAKNITDFPTRYHLCPSRANLLRPLSELLHGRVLEVGAGCGAISRFLGENGGSVVALEGSFRRALICRKRCRDLSNVAVFAGDLRDFQLSSQFDAVVVIGVLEYSRLFYGGVSGPAAMLQKCRQLLAPGGVLVLAIENQLGLKYFAGAPEDHLSIPFAGIEDQYGPSTQVTFGKNELQEILFQSGFPWQEFLYPFPDYKFPCAVLPASSLQHYSVTIASVLSMVAAPDQFTGYPRSFSEEMAWPVLLRNHLAEDLANAFLIVASDCAQRAARRVSIYTTSRRRAFSKVVMFDPQAQNPVALRSYLYPNRVTPHSAYEHRIDAEPLYRGRLCGEDFFSALNRPGWTEHDLVRCAGGWVDYLRRHATGAWLPPDFVDCTPFNLVMLADGTLHRFDQEWVGRQPTPMGFVLFRGFLDVLLRPRSCAPPGPLESARALDIVKRCIELTDAGAAQGMEEWLEREAELHEFAAGKGDIVRSVYPLLGIPPVRGAGGSGNEQPIQAAKLEEWRNRLTSTAAERDVAIAQTGAAKTELADVRARLSEAQTRLDEVLASRTWRWGIRIARMLGSLRSA